VSIKVNACCLHFATLIDALNECRFDSHFPVDQIEAIEVYGPKALLNGHMEYRPKSVMAAQYSLPFVTAVTLLLDPRSPTSYNEQAMSNTAVLAMADRVTAFEDDELEKLFPARFPARSKVIYKGGKVVESVVLDPLGSSERPLKRSDIIEKFHLLNQDVLAMPFQEDLIAAIEEIDAKGGLKRLTNLLNIKH
jgi:2-methylcitrate dehydratase PrpD